MKTKLLSIIIAAMAFLLPMQVVASDFEVDGLYYNKNSDGTTVTVTYQRTSTPRYLSLTGALNIPGSVTKEGVTYSVTAIDNNAFQGCKELTSVTIPNSVTSIGSYAFANCQKVTSVSIGNSVTSIGSYAFNTCSTLTSVTIPNSVTTISSNAFDNCYALTSMTIPNSVTSIGSYAFSKCYRITSIVVESGNPKYDSRDNCNAIIETATNKLIAGCKITSIPNTVTSIGEGAFYGNTNLTSMIIPNSVTIIGNSAFVGCTQMSSVIIPNSVTMVGNSAFDSCESLHSVTIPNSVTSIGSKAFNHCTALSSISVENGNPKYDSRDNCNAIIETGTNTLIAGCQNTIIPNSVTKIGDFAFIGHTGLNSVTISNSVTSIGVSAFSGCSGLTSVTIPKSVTSIGDQAFENCSGLTSMHIPNSVTKIGMGTFKGCTGLISVDIPGTVTSIGDLAFYGCSGLEQIYCKIVDPSSVPLGVYVFQGVTKSSCELYVPTISSEFYENHNDWKDFIIIKWDGTTLITGLAFAKKSTIADVGLIFLMEPIITPDDATTNDLSWTSSDATVATVDEFGKVTTLRGGVTTITASTTDGTNLSASYDLYVIDRNILIDALIASGNVVSGNVNTEIMLPLIVRNGVDITSLSFTITLPEQIELVDDINSFIVASERGENFTFSAIQNDNGSITINGKTKTNEPLEIGVGEILSLKVKAQKQDTYTIPITNMTVTTVDGLVRPLLNSETKLIIQSVFGDLNGDGEVDIADVNTLIDIMYGRY